MSPCDTERILSRESERLRISWDRHSQVFLDTYLASDVEDPRINAQSILTRALIVNTLYPRIFDAVIDAEFQFGMSLSWIVRHLRAGHSRWDLLDALENRNTTVIPEPFIALHEALRCSANPIPDYLSNALFQTAPDERGLISDSVLDTFAPIWRAALNGMPERSIAIVEPACGSANDYRYMAHYGLARFLDYSGFDISRKNIANAHARFPQAGFFLGNVFQIPAGDGAFDYLFVHDLFEHLSPKGLERAIQECLRVTRKEAWLSFFNIEAIPRHEVHVVAGYHWNTLSIEQTKRSLLCHARHVDVVDVAALMSQRLGFSDYHNRRAKTLIVEV